MGDGARRRAATRVLVGPLLLAALVTAGCGSSGGGSPSSSPASASSQAPVSSPASASSSPGLVGPVILTPQQTDATVTLGRTVVFDLGADPAAWTLAADNAAVLALESGGTRDGATFNWGARTLAVGTATVVATPAAGDQPVAFRVTVVAS